MSIEILYTERYSVDFSTGSYSLFVSKHSDGRYHATVIFYGKEGSWAEEQNSFELNFHFKAFVAESRDLLEASYTPWLEAKVGAKFLIRNITELLVELVDPDGDVYFASHLDSEGLRYRVDDPSNAETFSSGEKALEVARFMGRFKDFKSYRIFIRDVHDSWSA